MADKDLIISIEKSIRYFSACQAHGREILKSINLSAAVCCTAMGRIKGITIGELSTECILHIPHGYNEQAEKIKTGEKV